MVHTDAAAGGTKLEEEQLLRPITVPVAHQLG